jgi:hypothetical protein
MTKIECTRFSGKKNMVTNNKYNPGLSLTAIRKLGVGNFEQWQKLITKPRRAADQTHP